jgi:hypothetical protein
MEDRVAKAWSSCGVVRLEYFNMVFGKAIQVVITENQLWAQTNFNLLSENVCH